MPELTLAPPARPAPAADATPAAGPDATTLDEFLRALRDDVRLRPGDVFGAFTIRRLLKSGGMGEAYLAEQAPLKRLTIVKVIRGVGGDSDRVRFRNEWRVGGELHHTHLVPVYAAGLKGDRDYYVMPYVRGANLREVIDAVARRAAGPDGGRGLVVQRVVAELADAKDRAFVRPWEKLAGLPAAAAGPPVRRRLPRAYYEWVARRMIEAAHALATAHRAGVLHLDVKPSNVLVETPSDLTKVLDFGLAHRVGGADDGSPRAAAWEPAEVPWYAAPEIARDRRADQRADVYGLGACLYELVALTRLGAEAAAAGPPDLVAVARKAAADDPAGRYPTAEAFADDLQRWLDGRLPAARDGWRHAPRAVALWIRRNVPWTAVIAASLMLAGGASAWGIDRAEAGQKEEARKRERAEEEARKAEYVSAVLKAREALLGTLKAGWSRETRKHLDQAAGLKPGADLVNEAAATFGGLDAVHVYEFNSPDSKSRGVGLSYVAFAPDGVRLVGSGWGQPGRAPAPAGLWDGNAAKFPTEMRPGSGPVAYPDADSPLQLVVPTEETKALTLRNVATGKTLAELPLPNPGFVVRAALSPDARYAAAFFYDDADESKEPVVLTLLWALDRKAGSVAVKKIGQWPVAATALAFSPDGKLLATGSEAGEVIVRGTADGAELLRFPEGDLAIAGLAFGRNYRRPSGQHGKPIGPAAGWLLAVGGKGGGLSVWNLRTKTRLNSYYGSEVDVFGLAFSPDGTTLASAGRNYPFLWDVGTARPLLRVQRPGGGFRSWTEGVAFSPQGDRIAYGSGAAFSHGGLDIFRLEDGRGVRTYRGLTGVIEHVWLSPGGKWVAAVAQNWQLGVWDRATGEVRFVWDVPPGWSPDNTSVAFDENDTQVLFSSGRHVTRWSLRDGERTSSWKVPMGLNDCLITRPGEKPLLIRRDLEPRPAVLARELGPDDKWTVRHKLDDFDARHNVIFSATADGRVILANVQIGNDSWRPHFYDGLTRAPIKIDPALVPAVGGYVSMSGTGKAISIEGVRAGERRAVQYRFPSLTRLSEHSRDLLRLDDAGGLAVESTPGRPPGDGVALYRVGETRPLVTFDVGHAPVTGNAVNFSPDGRWVCWGRRDGTVSVADVNRCVEQLAPYGRR